jgi:heat shock protein HslJ
MRSPSPRRPVTLACAALLLLLAACGDDDDGATAAGDRPSGAADGSGGGSGGGDRVLVGRTFVSTAITEDGEPRPLADGTGVTLVFDDGQLRADAGCNSLSGPVEVGDDRLTLGEMSTTQMGCEPSLADQDAWLSEVLSADPAYTLDGATLELTSGTTVIELTDSEVADPDRPLEGTEWRLDSIVDGDTAGSVPAGSGATMTFADGHVSFSIEGCNTGGGEATVDDQTITLGPLEQTLMACAGAAGDVEAAVTAVLDGEITYAVDASTLTLTHPSGRGLVLRADG